MAMTKCKECGQRISTKADACPKCGATRKRTSPVGCLVGIVLLVLIFVGIVGSLDSNTEPSKTMSVEVSWGPKFVQIKNTENADISGKAVAVYVNGMPPFAHKAVCTGPDLGKAVRLPLSSFVKKNGERFNPYTHAVTEVWVGGAGYDFSSYRLR